MPNQAKRADNIGKVVEPNISEATAGWNIVFHESSNCVAPMELGRYYLLDGSF